MGFLWSSITSFLEGNKGVTQSPTWNRFGRGNTRTRINTGTTPARSRDESRVWRMNFFPNRWFNEELLAPDGSASLGLESVNVSAGTQVRLQIEKASFEREHAVCFQTEGLLRRHDTAEPGLEYWTKGCDEPTGFEEFEVESTKGRLIFYHAWDSGRGRRSQLDYSGMYGEDLGDGRRRYRCEDYGQRSEFSDLVFTIQVLN